MPRNRQAGKRCDYIPIMDGANRPAEKRPPIRRNRSEVMSRPRPSRQSAPRPPRRRRNLDALHQRPDLARRSPSQSPALRPRAPRRSSAWRMRSTSASGTRTPGTSFAMNSAWRRLSSGATRREHRNPEASIRVEETRRAAGIEHRLRDREFRAGLDLVLEPPQFLVEDRARRDWPRRRCETPSGTPMLCPPMSEPRFRRVTMLVRPIESTSNTAGGVRIVADLRRIAGDEQQVADPHRVRAEQVRLHPEQVPIAAGVMENRLDAGLLLHEHRRRQRAHPRAARGPSGMFTRSTPWIRSWRACSTSASARNPRGGTSSTRHDERAARQAVRHARLLGARPPAARAAAQPPRLDAAPCAAALARRLRRRAPAPRS